MLFFSDLEGVNEEGEAMELNIMDTDASRQPEIAYTEKETQEMVHEMLDTLPDDQRMCILMFHFEGASIREIAEAMECSENTVKSRLNYGRKAIKRNCRKKAANSTVWHHFRFFFSCFAKKRRHFYKTLAL